MLPRCCRGVDIELLCKRVKPQISGSVKVGAGETAPKQKSPGLPGLFAFSSGVDYTVTVSATSLNSLI
jgi:hypothetical protein